jgi:hypothetical protein
MLEQLSKIGFLAAHQKYEDIEMYRELCDYQDTNLTPAEIVDLALAKEEGRIIPKKIMDGIKENERQMIEAFKKCEAAEAEKERVENGKN